MHCWAFIPHCTTITYKRNTAARRLTVRQLMGTAVSLQTPVCTVSQTGSGFQQQEEKEHGNTCCVRVRQTTVPTDLKENFLFKEHTGLVPLLPSGYHVAPCLHPASHACVFPNPSSMQDSRLEVPDDCKLLQDARCPKLLVQSTARPLTMQDVRCGSRCTG